jgi:hypothetical protein
MQKEAASGQRRKITAPEISESSDWHPENSNDMNKQSGREGLDIIEKVADLLSVKVEWWERYELKELFETLKLNRYTTP